MKYHLRVLGPKSRLQDLLRNYSAASSILYSLSFWEVPKTCQQRFHICGRCGFPDRWSKECEIQDTHITSNQIAAMQTRSTATTTLQDDITISLQSKHQLCHTPDAWNFKCTSCTLFCTFVCRENNCGRTFQCLDTILVGTSASTHIARCTSELIGFVHHK